MSEPIIVLRNTVSGVAAEYPESLGRAALKAWPKVLVEVESSKNEVLSGPYLVDEDGERSPISDSSEGDKSPAVESVEKVKNK